MLSSPSLLAASVRHGLVALPDVRSGLVRLRPVPRSNQVHVIERAGVPTAYVKQPGAAAGRDGVDVAATEAAVLRALADLELAPAPILQGGSGPMWMTALPGVELASVTDAAQLHGAAVALGDALARLHQHSVPDGAIPEAALPWPLADRLPASMQGGEARPATRLVLEAAESAELAPAIQAATSDWAPTHVTHGDISARNVLVLIDEADQAVAVRLLDFELGGWGAPELDLACAAGLLTDLSEGGADLGETLTEAYAASGGPANLGWHWHCLRSLLTAWQVAVTHGEARLPVVANLLDRARAAAQGRS